MNKKSEFLSQAMTKLKETNANVTKGVDFVKEMNFIYSPSLLLRVWFDHTLVNPNSKDYPDNGYCFMWSKIYSVPIQAEIKAHRELVRRLQEVVSMEDAEDIDAVVEYLENVPDDKLNESAHGFEFEHNGRTVEIIMWQPVENWTIGQLNEHLN